MACLNYELACSSLWIEEQGNQNDPQVLGQAILLQPPTFLIVPSHGEQ
jgi:hypothetical protein